MRRISPDKLLKREMTRREFLQFAGGSVLILLGLGNFLQLLAHMRKTADTPPVARVENEASRGFGSRRFGV